METSVQIQIVLDAFPAIAIVAACLGRERTNVRFGNLAAQLCVFQKQVLSFPEYHRNSIQRDGSLCKALSHIEKIISVSIPTWN